MSYRGDKHDTAIILKTLEEKHSPDWTPADFRFYSVHRRPMTIGALESARIIESSRRGHYFVTPLGNVWIDEHATVFDPRSSNPKKITKTVTTSTQTVRVKNPYAMFSNPHGGLS